MKKETFCRYIRQYETDMFRFAKSIVGTQADGEDAMQESILKAYENIDTLRSRRKFKAWIFRNRKRQEPTDPFEFPEQEHSSDYWTEDMVSEDGEILSYILRMPKQHQEVLILYYYDEFSTKEIAKILDIPQGTVKSRLARGRKQLKDLLEMEGEGAYEGA
jgi:RNA polymerase sigma-70 factor (ECF subfamily)